MILQNQNISMTELFNLIGGTSDEGGTSSTGTLMAKVNAALDKLNDSSSSGSTINTGGAQEFTSNGTFTVPAGVTKIWVTACGAGGGGGGCLYSSDAEYTVYDGNGGNGGAAVKRQPFSVTPGQSIAITIGAGGAIGSNSSGTPTAGSTGGSTVVGSLITLPGGYGGQVQRANQKNNNNIGAGAGGLGAYARRQYVVNGTASTYSTSTSSAGDGDYGIDNNKGYGIYGGGGGGSLSYGGNGATTASAATAASYGGGGGGGASVRKSSTAYAPSKGGPGYCLIEW